MPELKSKARITLELQTERRRLENNLAAVAQADWLLPGVVGAWSIKDVLAHLAEWEAHMPVWLEAARRGEPVAEIESGLAWGNYDDFNRRIYER